MQLSLERIGDIVHEITQTGSVQLQTFAEEELKEWQEDWARNPHMQQKYCAYIRAQIREILPKRVRREARSALTQIKDRINMEAVQNAVIADVQRRSAEAMKRETLSVYEIVRKNGRGVVYFGSARTKPGEPFYETSRELGREVYRLLESTSWSGAGPGLMEAPLQGAKEAGGRVAGVKILLNGDESKFEQDINPVLEPENVAVCKFFGPRKIGLVDAAMRETEQDRTAVIALPGGFGTLDEFYEFIVLKQLNKLGSRHPVPIFLMNYDGYYDHEIEHIAESCIRHGTISEEELGLFHICNTNFEALETLAETYHIPEEKRTYRGRVPFPIVVSMNEGEEGA